MPMTEAPSWWADVQDSREELDAPDRSLEWSDDEFDLVPPTVGRWAAEPERTERPRRRFAREPQTEAQPAEAPVRQPAEHRAAASVDPVEVVVAAQAERLERVRSADDDFLGSSPPRPEPTGAAELAPAAGSRRTVQITGRPGEARLERRRPPRSPSEMVADRPDRIAAWAAAFGFLLLIVAYVSGA